MDITCTRTDKALIIEVSGRLDTTTASDFEARSLEEMADAKNIIIDLKQVEYVSSAGLRGILSVGKKVRAEGGTLVFCNLQGMVREVFEISGFSSIFTLHETREKALEGF
ncbi:STAS domain-containing protein [Desulfonatronovibrio hydrogenovorans]|uniref:STAS domain-containing protein n=1 Tax=Desulfonatronovibrio hydrogenovorans TaxID=53245 RepID=UPI0004915B73|nr:STAS domain-containing protein [Desulfonatronovibrio hydrogenovorans]